MQRVTISIDDDLDARFDALVRDHAYGTRSEAMRDPVRQRVDDAQGTSSSGRCVANLSCVHNHSTQKLAARLLDLPHAVPLSG